MNEIERRWVLTDAPKEITPLRVQRIVQVYLPRTGDRLAERVRRIRESGQPDRFVYTMKVPRFVGVNEIEADIDADRFREMAASRYARNPISKTRIVFKHAGQTWELDEFHYPLHGLSILEIELGEEALLHRPNGRGPTISSRSAKLPPGFVGFEVTGDSRYSNAALYWQDKPPSFLLPEELVESWHSSVAWDHDIGGFAGRPEPRRFFRPKAVFSRGEVWDMAKKFFGHQLLSKGHTKSYWNYLEARVDG